MAKDDIYKFVGWGQGVPGLPHVLTEEQAKEMGVWELLQEAVKNGNYQKEKEKAVKNE